jgi:hypothetical protein
MLSGLTCAGACNSGYSGTPVALCTNGVYTVSGSCQPGKGISYDDGAARDGVDSSFSVCLIDKSDIRLI